MRLTPVCAGAHLVILQISLGEYRTAARLSAGGQLADSVVLRLRWRPQHQTGLFKMCWIKSPQNHFRKYSLCCSCGEPCCNKKNRTFCDNAALVTDDRRGGWL